MIELGFLKSLILGLIQGITEFLPVSSSAHLIIVSWWFEGKSLPLFLNTALHTGTLFAIICYFWKDWFNLVKGLLEKKTHPKNFIKSSQLLTNLVIGSIPAAFVGLLLKNEIESYFHNPTNNSSTCDLWFCSLVC